jgi:aminoglycoside/choline kinase family phosphotransferase
VSGRDALIKDFLNRSGWGAAQIAPLPGDASTRRYARLTLGTRKAMLMDQPQDAETPAAPSDADAAARQALGYNALARLAGADCARFVAVADYLTGRGLSAPRILAADAPNGLLVLEDLGDALFADVVTAGGDEAALYRAAVDVLAHLHAEPAPALLPRGKPLYAYDDIALVAETELVTDWYLPHALGRAATADEIKQHRALWQAALKPLADAPKVLVHRDYHAQNLLWLPERQAAQRVGLIDFQDAVAGSRAYDLVSLIEDARRDVDPALAEAMTRHYLYAMGGEGVAMDEQRFRHEMAVIAAQRNAKILGIFARLARRDGKPRYLALLPRVWGYLERDLAHPELAALKGWYDRLFPAGVRRP